MSSRKGPFKATLTASTHRPTSGKPWRWSVKVETRDGKPLAATTRLLYLFGGQVVGRGGRQEFVGDRRGTIRWPQRSVGFPLTFRVAISTAKGRLELDYPVQVRSS